MALPVLNAPPFRTPLVDSKGMVTPAWQKWIDVLWRKTGAESTMAPISVTGAASAVTPTSGSGSPESVVTAPPGSLYIDDDTSTVYIKETGDGPLGWDTL